MRAHRFMNTPDTMRIVEMTNRRSGNVAEDLPLDRGCLTLFHPGLKPVSDGRGQAEWPDWRAAKGITKTLTTKADHNGTRHGPIPADEREAPS
jgi:hypothetical protein